MEPIITLLIVILCFIGLLYLIYLDEKRKIKLKEQAEQAVLEWAGKFEQACRNYKLSGIPEDPTPVGIKMADKVYFHLKGVEWIEYRKVQTGRYSAHGITGRVKIVKGLSFRFGSGQISRESIDQLTPLDTGELYLTSKGFLFRGEMGNKTIPFEKIININPAPNHISIERSTGKDIYLKYDFEPYPEKVAATVIAWNRDYLKQFGDE